MTKMIPIMLFCHSFKKYYEGRSPGNRSFKGFWNLRTGSHSRESKRLFYTPGAPTWKQSGEMREGIDEKATASGVAPGRPPAQPSSTPQGASVLGTKETYLTRWLLTNCRNTFHFIFLLLQGNIWGQESYIKMLLLSQPDSTNSSMKYLWGKNNFGKTVIFPTVCTCLERQVFYTHMPVHSAYTVNTRSMWHV